MQVSTGEGRPGAARSSSAASCRKTRFLWLIRHLPPVDSSLCSRRGPFFQHFRVSDCLPITTYFTHVSHFFKYFVVFATTYLDFINPFKWWSNLLVQKWFQKLRVCISKGFLALPDSLSNPHIQSLRFSLPRPWPLEASLAWMPQPLMDAAVGSSESASALWPILYTTARVF